MDIEKLAKEIFDECEKDGEPVSMEEALEMARMEVGAKEIKSYTQSVEKPKAKKKPKEKKIDEEKAEIIKILHQALIDNGYEASITNADKYIDFGCYTINLVKHRPKK